MIAPKPVPERSLRRLRRGYAWLMLALSVPVLAAAVYVLVLQYEIVWFGAQRQLAMSTERRVTQLDAVLGRMREDMQRLGHTARSPGLLTRDVEADRQALAVDAAGAWTLDALPALLTDRAPQVILFGPAWADAGRRGAAVERAALFAEQAELAMLRGGRFGRVTHVDAGHGEVWIYPWIRSSDWLAELSAPTFAAAVRAFARRLGLDETQTVAIQDDVRWCLHEGAAGKRSITLALALGSLAGQRFVAADAPLAALADTELRGGVGRFWVVDGDGRVVIDHDASAAAGAPPPLALGREGLAALQAAPLAQQVGPALVAVRASTVAPWSALVATDRAEVRRRVLRELWPYLGGGVLLMLLFVALAVLIWQRFGRPSLQLVDYLQRQAADASAPEPAVPRAWVPWMQLTHDTFAAWREALAGEQKSEALKSAIVDHALVAVVTFDAAGAIVDFNPAAERMFARRRDEVVGRSPSGLIVPASVHDASAEDLQRLRRGEPPRLLGRRVEATALRADGSEFPVELSLWRTRVGQDVFFTASMTDLTERRAAAEEIERQRDALRQAEKLAAMGSLLAGVAHELNNPLAIVMGRASLLEAKCTDPALRVDAARIREAADRCGRIVRTFLAMARRRPAARAPVQLNDLVRGAVDLLQYNLRSGGVAVELRLQPGLPEVVADADQLGQVLLNLIVNAQQALAPAEPPRQMRIETGHDAGRVWLRVADNGGGVPEAERARIFDAFVTTKKEGVGTGLGLAVSRAVAVEHGGDLRLEDASPFGRGASFRLELPLPAAAPAAAASTDTAPGADAQPAGARILVVDDEPELAAMMRDALEGAGYEVATAESGAVALAMIDEGRFDAVVTDLRMPDMDGRALWHGASARQPGLARRFVFVTGDTLSPRVAELRRETGAEWLEKPFSADDLVQRVRRACEETDRCAVT